MAGRKVSICGGWVFEGEETMKREKSGAAVCPEREPMRSRLTAGPLESEPMRCHREGDRCFCYNANGMTRYKKVWDGKKKWEREGGLFVPCSGLSLAEYVGSEELSVQNIPSEHVMMKKYGYLPSPVYMCYSHTL